jgi:hypothetical protein
MALPGIGEETYLALITDGNSLYLNEGKTNGGSTNPQVIAKCFARKCVQSCIGKYLKSQGRIN